MAEVGIGFGIIRIELDCFPVSVYGFIGHSVFREGDTHIVVDFRQSGLNTEVSFILLYGRVDLSLSSVGDAGEIVRIGCVRVNLNGLEAFLYRGLIILLFQVENSQKNVYTRLFPVKFFPLFVNRNDLIQFVRGQGEDIRIKVPVLVQQDYPACEFIEFRTRISAVHDRILLFKVGRTEQMGKLVKKYGFHQIL